MFQKYNDQPLHSIIKQSAYVFAAPSNDTSSILMMTLTIDNIRPMDWKLISATCHHPCFAPPYTRNG